jgi:hypothetical protein
LANLPFLIGTAALKLNLSPVPPGWPPQLHLLAEQIPWWGLSVWALMVALYLVVGQALFRGRPAFGLFALAFVTEVVRWVPMYALPAYTKTWTAGELGFRYIAFGVLVVIGVIIWGTERRYPAHARFTAAGPQ